MEVSADKIIEALSMQNAVLNRELIKRDILISELLEKLNGSGPAGTDNAEIAGDERLPEFSRANGEGK